MKICIYGGTFNPPHNGHINICREFLENYEVDKFLVIPSYIPPHKEIYSNISCEDRYNMAKIAFENLNDIIEISDLEIKRKGKSYTADTIKSIKSLYDAEIYLLCGTDMFVTLDEWYNPEYILKNAKIVYAFRENDESLLKMSEEKTELYIKKYGASISRLNCNILEISSTEIRDKIAFDMNVRNFIPKNVLKYIEEKKLYGEFKNDR